MSSPSKRLSRRVIAAFLAPGVLVGVALGVIGWGGFNTAMEATNSLEFCISCHEMRDTVYQEYINSTHYKNPSGVRAICSDCHVPKDWTHKMIRKIQASKELYYKFTGSIDTPEKFAARRIDLARHEWERMRASDSRECRNCHSFDAMDFHRQNPRAAAQMQQAAQQGTRTCIDCHKGVVHRMPDLTARYKAMHAALAVASDTLAPGALVITHRQAPLFLTPPPETGEGVGTVAPFAHLRVSEVKDGFLKVSLTGWQRAGYEEQLVAGEGLRILQATLKTPALEALDPVKPGAVLDDEHEWREVRLSFWIARDRVTTDEKALQRYGAEMFESSCATCHALHKPEQFDANDWIGKMNAMKRFTPLNPSEYELLLAYVQQRSVERR